MRTLVLSIASVMVIPNIVLLLLVARPRPTPAVPLATEAGIQQIVIKGSEYAFDPAQISLPPAGQRVRLVFANEGTVRHVLAIKGLVNDEVILDLERAGKLPRKLEQTANEDGGKGMIFLAAEPGGVAVAEFTVGKSATYDAVCTLKGHERRGMVAKIVVP